MGVTLVAAAWLYLICVVGGQEAIKHFLWLLWTDWTAPIGYYWAVVGPAKLVDKGLDRLALLSKGD